MSSVEKDNHPVSDEKYGTDASNPHRLDRDWLDGNCAQRRMQCASPYPFFSFVQVADPVQAAERMAPSAGNTQHFPIPFRLVM